MCGLRPIEVAYLGRLGFLEKSWPMGASVAKRGKGRRDGAGNASDSERRSPSDVHHRDSRRP